jgi:hypothetical protein
VDVAQRSCATRPLTCTDAGRCTEITRMVLDAAAYEMVFEFPA